MKLVQYVFLLMIAGGCTLVSAEDITLKQQIKEILDAPKEQRVKLMNNFKQQLAQMDFFQRSDAIALLQQAQHNTLTQTQQIIEARKQENAQEMQVQSYTHLTQYQSFLQRAAQDAQRKLPIPTDPISFP
jgi:septum formation inhibitor MinC